MNLILLRTVYTAKSTIGTLLVNNAIFSHTLEDVVRGTGNKVYGKTAIDAGRYEVILSESNRFKKILPELLLVPNFKGVRMHGGNTSEDTEGCILVAKKILNKDTIQGSKSNDLVQLLLDQKDGPCFIEIINTYPYCGV